MTKFRCDAGDVPGQPQHEFTTPARLWFDDYRYEGGGYYYWGCPVCHEAKFHVIELGGEPVETDACEGSCTL